MIDELCKLSDFGGYGVTSTDMLKYVAEQTGLVYHKHTSLFLEHLYLGRSPTDYEILLVYDQGTYQMVFEHPVIEKLEEYRRDVSPNTVEDVINMIKAHIKNLKQATIDKKKKALEEDFSD